MMSSELRTVPMIYVIYMRRWYLRQYSLLDSARPWPETPDRPIVICIGHPDWALSSQRTFSAQINHPNFELITLTDPATVAVIRMWKFGSYLNFYCHDQIRFLWILESSSEAHLDLFTRVSANTFEYSSCPRKSDLNVICAGFAWEQIYTHSFMRSAFSSISSGVRTGPLSMYC